GHAQVYRTADGDVHFVGGPDRVAARQRVLKLPPPLEPAHVYGERVGRSFPVREEDRPHRGDGDDRDQDCRHEGPGDLESRIAVYLLGLGRVGSVTEVVEDVREDREDDYRNTDAEI